MMQCSGVLRCCCFCLVCLVEWICVVCVCLKQRTEQDTVAKAQNIKNEPCSESYRWRAGSSRHMVLLQEKEEFSEGRTLEDILGY